jgi:formate dehydrogenase beta subunit
MIVEAIAIGGLGVAAALGLGAAAKIFYVEVDPLAEAVEEALPGANCGGCGFAGCSSAAEAIAKGTHPPSICVGGGPEVQEEVAAILGVELTATEPQIAQVGCRYPVKRSDLKFNYAGLSDCRSAVLIAGGPKECPVGCIGLGSCAKACPFDALSIGDDGLPVVDPVKCTGCGTCVRTCPMGIMQLTSVTARILGEFTTEQCHAPCQRTCPAGIDIPKHIRETAVGDYEAALLTIKERNPLPLICGRICPHPCEAACRRNLEDEPVAINYLKRYVADLERKNGNRLQPYKAPPTGRKQAIVGGGAEGLSAAWFLARLGHSPEVFEALPQLGGILREVIPASRLPRDVLDYEVEGILEIGVKAHTSQALGRDFSIKELFEQGFESVTLATGGWDTSLLRGGKPDPAPGLKGVYLQLPLGMALLQGQSVDLGGKAVLVGGGKTALSLAKRIKEQGSEEVTILDWRAEQAEPYDQDGVKIIPGARVTRIIGRDDSITRVGFIALDAESGQCCEQFLEASSLIPASGRLPELILVRVPDSEDMSWQSLRPYSGPTERFFGMFETQEPVSDFAACVEAIGAGRRVAASVHKYITGEEVTAPEHMLGPDTKVLDVNSELVHLIDVPARQPMPMADEAAQYDPDQEVELGYGDEEVKAEAGRCLNCGLICYYRSQYN